MRLRSRAATVACLHASVICLFLTHALAAPDSCFTRQACGDAKISRRGCEMRGCCWDDSADASGPHCFYRGSNVETCDALKNRSACGLVERTEVSEEVTHSEGYGYITDDNVPVRPVVQEDHGEVTVEVIQAEGYGQHPDEDAAESVEETSAEASIAEGVGENVDLVEQVVDAEETAESIEEAFAEASIAEGVGELPEITKKVAHEEAYGYSDDNPKQTTSEAGAEGIGHDGEFFVEVVDTEGVGEHPEDAISPSVGSDAKSEDRKPETVTLQSAKRPQIEKSEFGGEMFGKETDLEDLEEPSIDISFAYGSVGAPESMMELEDMPLLSHASEFRLTYAPKAKQTQMAIQRKEQAALYKSKSDVICDQSTQSKIEKIGWLVLLKNDEPIELFAMKKDSRDDSDNKPSIDADSGSLLKSPRTQFAKMPIETVPTSITTVYPPEFFKTSNELMTTDSKQDWPLSHGSGRVPQVDTAGNTEIEGVVDKKTKQKISDVWVERSMPDVSCSLSKHIPCGNGNVSKKECSDLGCCWVPLSRRLIQAGCYLNQPEAEAITFDLEQVSI